MNRSLCNKKSVFTFADCSKYKQGDVPVQPNLAMTPAKVKDLTERGIAVAISEPYFDGEDIKGDFSLDPIFSRGMDQNTLWENSQLSRQKLNSARDSKTILERTKLKEKENE